MSSLGALGVGGWRLGRNAGLKVQAGTAQILSAAAGNQGWFLEGTLRTNLRGERVLQGGDPGAAERGQERVGQGAADAAL